MTERTYTDGVVERFTYDPNGNLIAAENNTSSVRREFDEDGNVVVETQGAFIVKNTFDLLGRRLQRESGFGNVLTIAYDACDRPSMIELNGWPVLSARYGANGQVSEAVVGRSLRRMFKDNDDGRLIQQELRRPGVVALRRYRYDAVGNLTERIDQHKGTQTLTCDLLDRVVKQSGPAQRGFELRYDAAGDLLHAMGAHDSPGRATRPRQFRDTRYEFDVAGNGVRRVSPSGTATFNWNGANRLIEAVNERGAHSTYAYDALGRRVFKEVGDVRTNFFWDSDVLLAEQAFGGVVREYVFLEGTFEPVASYISHEIFHFEVDHVSLPHEVVNENGDVVWSATYGPTGRGAQPRRYAERLPIAFSRPVLRRRAGTHVTTGTAIGIRRPQHL